MKITNSLIIGLFSILFAACATKDESPEAKVVEIHMTGHSASKDAEETKRRGRRETMPLMDHSALCSGEFITPQGHVLTAKHCVEGFDSFDVVTSDGSHYTATVTAVSPTHDLALLHVDCLYPAYFALARETHKGDHIRVMGSPLAITGVTTEGYIAKKDGDTLLLDCGVLPGNSGGPVVNDAGELVGVATAGFVVLFGMTHLNIAQSADAVYHFMTQTAHARTQ